MARLVTVWIIIGAAMALFAFTVSMIAVWLIGLVFTGWPATALSGLAAGLIMGGFLGKGILMAQDHAHQTYWRSQL